MLKTLFCSKNVLVALGVTAYFVAMLVTTQFEGVAVSLLWYSTVLFGAVCGLFCRRFRLAPKEIYFIIVMVSTGVLNALLVGTTSVRQQALLVLLFLLSLMFTSEYVHEDVFFLSALLNVALVILKFMIVGFSGNIYTTSSSNYVSVYLMYPTVIYYILCEKNGKASRSFLAIVVWVLSLLSRGRGGIIATTVLVVGLLIVKYKNTGGAFKLLIMIIGILVLTVAVLNIERIIRVLDTSVVSEYFRQRGMRSSRTYVWSEYIERTICDFKNIIIGTDVKNVLLVQELNGNPHNSFIAVHMNNGLIMLVLVLVLFVRQITRSIRNRYYIYTICALSMVIRSFTDSIFWPTYGTAVLFFLLFIDLKEHNHNRVIKDNKRIEFTMGD